MSISVIDDHFEVRKEARRRVDSEEEAHRLEQLLAEGIHAALTKFENGEQPCISIPDGLDDFLSYQQTVEANMPSTLAAYNRRLSRFIDAWGDIPISNITRRMILDWQCSRLNDPGKRRRYHPDTKVCRDTVNHELKALRRFARWAYETERAPARLDIMMVKPLKVKGKVEGNRFVPKTRVRHDYLRILSAIERAGYDHLCFVLEGMQLFFLREEALFQITARHVVMPTSKSVGELDAPPLKQGPEGSIAISYGSKKHKLILRLISFWKKQHGRKPRKDEPLFINTRGRSKRRPLGWTTDTFCQSLRSVCDRLGFHDFTAYQARHSIISWLQQQSTVSLADIQAAARHMRISTQEVYSHRSGKDGLSAYEASEKYMDRSADSLSENEDFDGFSGHPADWGFGDKFPELQNIENSGGCEGL